MPVEDLLSVVMILRYQEPFRSGERYLGRAAHKIALGLLSQVDQDQADRLHEHNDIMPMTVSDLFQSDAHHHWMRVTAIGTELVTHWNNIVQTVPDTLHYDGWTVVKALDKQHDWSGRASSFALLREYWHTQRTITLEFAAPTSIKSQGLHRPFPDAALLMRSLYARWQELSVAGLPYAPSAEALDLFLTYAIEVRGFNLQAIQVPMKHSTISAFKGTVTYHISSPSRALKRYAKRDTLAREVIQQYDNFSALFNFLTAFGFYAGVGVKTAQGMGMMRRCD